MTVISAAAPVGTLHFVDATAYKAQKALIAAKFNGVAIKEAKFDPAKDAQKPEFVAMNPTGKLPCLETDGGCIFTSNAIARFVARCRADTFMFGKTFEHEGVIDTWLEFCTHELEVPLMTWLYPVLGLMEDNPEATKAAQEDMKGIFATLERQLERTKYLIGDFLSLADIAVVCALREGFSRVFDEAFRAPYPKVCTWFGSCCALPQFRAVLGDVALCKQAEKPKAVAAPKKEEKKKKEEKPKTEPKAQPKAAAQAPASPPAVATGDLEAKVKAAGDEIRALKEKLKAEGLSGKKINDHEQVKSLVSQMQQLKEQLAAAPAAAPAAATPAAAPAAAPAAIGADMEAQVKAVGDEIRALKEKLKAEGLSGKKINDHEEIAKLVGKLQELKAQLPSSTTPAAQAAPAAPAPAAPGAGDVEAQIKAVGDEIRALKEKLKAEGLSGKKVNEHAEVKALVAKLQELKAQTA